MSAVRPEDRLGFTTLVSAIVNAVIILGIGFSAEDKPENALPSLDVILVQTSTQEAPEKADFLAQANQKGGGESDDSNRPAEPLISPIVKDTPGIAPVPLIAAQAAIVQPAPPAPEDELLTRMVDDAPALAEYKPDPDPTPTAALTIDRDAEMARLAAEIDRSREAYAKRPRRKFISANTREYAFAEYMAGWVAKVERVGNLNYPEESRSDGLYGSLVLSVAVRRDGSIESIDVIQSSGIPVLDAAAERIVMMSAPFSALEQREMAEIDVLHVTRTWQFLPGNVLRHD